MLFSNVQSNFVNTDTEGAIQIVSALTRSPYQMG